MPIGLAGLIVAGIFAAAQSTVSTSMNSTATSAVTDFLRPYNLCETEKGYLRAAQGLTFFFGVIGTVIGLIFVDPSIKSLFDVFIAVIGLFMGVLGGLFVLGIFSRRANAFGATCGVTLGVVAMFSLWRFTDVNGYIYTTCGITTCVVVGLLTSYCTPKPQKEIHSLTVYSLFSKKTQPE